MCTLAAGLAISAIGTVWQGYVNSQAASAQAYAAEQQAEYQAQINEYNARQARADAETVTEQETDADLQLRQQRRALRGAQYASVGGSGTLLSSGDIANLDASTFMQSEQDLAMNRRNYNLNRLQYLNEATGQEWQAANTRAAGRYQSMLLRRQGKNAILGSILTAGGMVASRWDDLRGS